MKYGSIGFENEAISRDHKEFVSSLATGIEIIRTFNNDCQRLTLSELAKIRGINRAKARRFLLTLHSLGYVKKEDRYFELSPKVLELGFAFLSANRYQNTVNQVLEHITEVTGESSSMGVLDGQDVMYIARSAAHHRLMAVTLNIGSRLPAAVTSMGRVLLAFTYTDLNADLVKGIELKQYTDKTITDHKLFVKCLIDVKAKGYCIVDQELESGLRSMAVPVFDTRNRLIGAINISTNAARVSYKKLENDILPLLLKNSKKIQENT